MRWKKAQYTNELDWKCYLKIRIMNESKWLPHTYFFSSPICFPPQVHFRTQTLNQPVIGSALDDGDKCPKINVCDAVSQIYQALN